LTGGYVAGLAMALTSILLATLPFWTVRVLRTYR
jgi:hypothetical protein